MPLIMLSKSVSNGGLIRRKKSSYFVLAASHVQFLRAAERGREDPFLSEKTRYATNLYEGLISSFSNRVHRKAHVVQHCRQSNRVKVALD